MNLESAKIFYPRHVVEINQLAVSRALFTTSASLLARGTPRRRSVKDDVASIGAAVVDFYQGPIDFVFDTSTCPTSDTGGCVYVSKGMGC